MKSSRTTFINFDLLNSNKMIDFSNKMIDFSKDITKKFNIFG